MIQVQNITKTYHLNKKQKKELRTTANSINAVNQVSFECTPGRVYSLLGPNGAGKTTTLRMMSTILKPSSGKMSIAGHDVESEPEKVRAKIGFLTGSTNLYDRLNPSEIVDYFGQLHNMSSNELKTRKDALFTQLGIHEFSQKKIGQMSTGMKQKVSIARSMIHNPEAVSYTHLTLPTILLV